MKVLCATSHETGKPIRENGKPLPAKAWGDVTFASNAGSPTEPDWYHNIVAHPQVTIEFGTETFDATATIVTGEERDRLYNRQAKVNPVFADFQANTDRVIPVITLQR